ncbi:hypothetical protein ACHHYP_04704 [Achlya hypogyna]|uniref:Uncharacterized protein n=1 Tax=Achlya hypogyna TaxID=1202772 RepID=A0A1V9Z0G5_ACHHY|nr:hypothetical protein ACHHYP_04704 [Achlya hypogyna]
MNHHAIEPMSSGENSFDPPVPPFCLQRYIKPLDDKRYIVSYSLPIESSDGKTTSPSMCEAFLAQYSRRYNSSKGCEPNHLGQNGPRDARHHLFSNPQVSFNFHTSLGTEEAKLVSPIMRMKHLTTALAHAINSRKGQHAQRVRGMVCEFIIGEADDQVYFTAILGVSWQDQPTSSWDELRHVDPESKMIWQYHRDRARRQSPSPSRPQEVKSNPPSPQLQSPRFPSLANGHVAISNNSWTKGLVSADMSPRYTNASPSKFFRDGRFVTKLSALQCETSCRLHIPMHRACRPALLVDLARQIEDYREDLVEQKEKRLMAEEAACASAEETKIALTQKARMEKTVEGMRIIEERHQEQWAQLCMAAEEREARAAAVIKKQAQEIDVLTARNTAEDISLRRELHDCNEQLKQLHITEVQHVETLALKDEAIAQLEADKEKARQQAIVDAIQREGSQNHIHSLRAQISLLKRDKEVLRKEANKYMMERDDLLRVLPIVTSLSEKRSGKPVKMNLVDILGPDSAKEHNMLQLMTTSHARVLKSIYKHLAPSKHLSTAAYIGFALECGFMTPLLTRDELLVMVQKACFGKDKDSVTSLSYAQFCECLIRVANVRYLTDLPQLTKRFGHLVEKDLLPYVRSVIPSMMKSENL